MYPQKEDPLLLLLDALGKENLADAIERQEARGQQLLVNSQTLPKKIHNGTRDQFKRMGIVFGEDADDLFVYVTLPQGWRKESTSHTMWSKLLDEKGRERASIFYKAAIYDRDAYISVSRRFSYSQYITSDEYGNQVEDKGDNHFFATWILDAGNPITLIGTRNVEYNNPDRDIHSKAARTWLSENYPNWEDAEAYWD